jgi:hypothetical protein
MSLFLLLTIILGIASGIIQLFGYFVYLKKINIGRIRPNTASWSIWTFGAILESSSYAVASGDWVKNLLPFACLIGSIILFALCLKMGHFSKISRSEWFLVVMDCFAIFLWWRYDSAVYANLFLVFIAIISFIPIIIHVWKDPMVEDATPWYLWTVAYFILIIVVLIRWEKWEDLVYPTVFVFLHIVIAILSLDNRLPKKLIFKN